jgi:tRNA pseudouridine55 synthase
VLDSGLLNINKPQGLTSRDAVDMVQRLARPAKVGHAGTLDPLATGVLVVCVGSATRLIEYVQRMPKRYVGTFLLGRSSPTEDVDGEVTLLADPPIPTAAQIEAAAEKFVGSIVQQPPAYSALKVAGRRAYDMARRGEVVELQPRPIEVYGLRIVRCDYPELVIELECGGGTYVRSLGRDLAESLGTAAVMSALVRTAIGPWTLETSVDPRTLTPANWEACLEPPRKALSSLPVCEVNPADSERIRRGLFVSLDASVDTTGNKEIVAVDCEGSLVAILIPRGAGQWGAAKNF